MAAGELGVEGGAPVNMRGHVGLLRPRVDDG